MSNLHKFVDRLLEEEGEWKDDIEDDSFGPTSEKIIDSVHIQYTDGSWEDLGFTEDGDLDMEQFSKDGAIMNAGGETDIGRFTYWLSAQLVKSSQVFKERRTTDQAEPELATDKTSLPPPASNPGASVDELPS